MVGMTFAIPVLFVIIGLYLLYVYRREASSNQYFIGAVMTWVFGVILICAVVAVPLKRAQTYAWMEKYDAVRVLLIDFQKKGDCLERVGFGIKIAELNAELAEKQYYSTCFKGIFAPYFPSDVRILRQMRPFKP